jgi:hypothetical protein
MPFKTITVTINDQEQDYKLHANWYICNRCEGDGTHSNPAIDGNGITQSEMEELGDDFREDYMSGKYDIECKSCHGSGKTLEIDTDYFKSKYPLAYEAWLKDQEEEIDYKDTVDSEARWERRMMYGSDY